MDRFKEWLRAAGVRALKTAAQTAVAMVPVGVSIVEVGWAGVLGTAALAALLSLLTSVAGLPEVGGGATLAEIQDGRGGDEG